MALDCSRSRQCWCFTLLRSAVDGSYSHLPVPLRSARFMDFSRARGFWAWPRPSGPCLRCGAGGALKGQFEAPPCLRRRSNRNWNPFRPDPAQCFGHGLVGSRLPPIDHEVGHSGEECPKDLLGLDGQRGFRQSVAHQLHPAVASDLIDRKRKMPRAEPWMASLFDVALRPSEPVDQEIPEALLGTFEIPRRVHASQELVLRDLAIEGGHQARETFRANH